MDEVLQRSELAQSFVEHPYWAVVAKMLSGTIQSETEEMLSGDDHIHSNRASVAICRRILQMPFFDIQQGNLARSTLAVHEARLGIKRGAPDGAERV